MLEIDLERLLAEYRRDGVVRIRQLLSKSEVDSIRLEIERYIRDDLKSKPADAATREADEATIRNLWRLERHNEKLRALAMRQDFLNLVGPLVNGVPTLAGIETFNKPARIGSGVPHHQDNAYFCQTTAGHADGVDRYRPGNEVEWSDLFCPRFAPQRSAANETITGTGQLNWPSENRSIPHRRPILRRIESWRCNHSPLQHDPLLRSQHDRSIAVGAAVGLSRRTNARRSETPVRLRCGVETDSSSMNYVIFSLACEIASQ